MKKIIVITATCLALWVISCNKTADKGHGSQVDSATAPQPKIERPLRVVFLQDLTGSIKRNGVEIVSPIALAPFFENIHRSVDIYYGVISDNSYQRFVPLTLPAATFIPTVQPDVRSLSPDEQIRVKNEYVSQWRAFEADSLRFYQDRNGRIRKFISDAESLIGQRQGQLAGSSDICTAVRIADKIFNYSVIDSARNILLINSDGLDTKGNRVTKIVNDVEVYLIGANDKDPTCVDSIVTRRFAFIEQAIQFTLKKQ